MRRIRWVVHVLFALLVVGCRAEPQAPAQSPALLDLSSDTLKARLTNLDDAPSSWSRGVPFAEIAAHGPAGERSPRAIVDWDGSLWRVNRVDGSMELVGNLPFASLEAVLADAHADIVARGESGSAEGCVGERRVRLHRASVGLWVMAEQGCVREALQVDARCDGTTEHVAFRSLATVIEAELGAAVWLSLCSEWAWAGFTAFEREQRAGG